MSYSVIRKTGMYVILLMFIYGASYAGQPPPECPKCPVVDIKCDETPCVCPTCPTCPTCPKVNKIDMTKKPCCSNHGKCMGHNKEKELSTVEEASPIVTPEAPDWFKWSARLGVAEHQAVDFGLSRAITRRWGVYINGRWLTNPRRVLLWPTRANHNSTGSELDYFREDEISGAVGMEFNW